MESIDLWYKLITGNTQIGPEHSREMRKLLQGELPNLSSLIMERTCNLSCKHCIFLDEKSSRKISEASDLKTIIITITTQLPQNASVIHEGRILRDWHVPILAKIKRVRPDISIGLIDNGTYLKVAEKLHEEKFFFDWIDISIDGTKEFHNKQRGNQEAYATAIKGLCNARQYIYANGRVTSLFTATTINYANVYEAAAALMSAGLIDEFHVVPNSPTFREDDLVMSLKEWSSFWKSFIKAHALGASFGIPVYLRIYKHEDIKKLAETTGHDSFRAGFTNKEEIQVSTGSISFLIEGMRIIYIPISICSTETFVIDVDGHYRLPYCVKYTLDELLKKQRGNEDLSAYTVAEIQKTDNYADLYKKGASKWWDNFGERFLYKEKEVINNLLLERS